MILKSQKKRDFEKIFLFIMIIILSK